MVSAVWIFISIAMAIRMNKHTDPISRTETVLWVILALVLGGFAIRADHKLKHEIARYEQRCEAATRAAIKEDHKTIIDILNRQYPGVPPSRACAEAIDEVKNIDAASVVVHPPTPR
jgi:hypothetical protein